MSRTLSTNSGSLDSLNVSERCGCSPKAVQIRRIVVCEKPVAPAIERIDQARCIARQGTQRPLDHGGHLIVVDRPRPAGPGFVQQALDAILEEAAPPLADRVLMHSQFSRDDLAGHAAGASQDDPASLGHRSRHTLPSHLSFEIVTLAVTKDQTCRRSTHRVRHRCAPSLKRRSIQCNELQFQMT